MPEQINYDLDRDKLGLNELSLKLRDMVTKSFNHTKDDVIHITAEERALWNTVATIPNVSNNNNGFMSIADKVKLDGIEEHANHYVHPKKPNAIPGNYITVDIDNEGHVTRGYNPTRLPITVDNADRLGGLVPGDFAPIANPIFLGKPQAPTPVIDADSTKMEIVNVKYLESHIFPYVRSRVEPTGDGENLFWIDSTNILSSYSKEKKWHSVYTEASKYMLALNEKIDVNTQPSDYAAYLKFYGQKKLSALNLDTAITGTRTEEFATVMGMRAVDQDISHEFIFIGNDLFIRSGADNWDSLVKIFDSNDETVAKTKKAMEFDIDNGSLVVNSGGKKYKVTLTEV